MANVEIYTTMMCPYCTAAKRLLKSKNVNFVEYDVTFDRAGRVKMSSRADGKTSVPQIFIDEVHIGGCDDLHALENAGGLDKLLITA